MMRQRLVGALVLLCLGVIVWSLLFTGSADYKTDRDSQIPPTPRIEPVLEQAPQIPEGVPTVEERRLPPQPQLPVADNVPAKQVEGGEGVRAAAEPPPQEASQQQRPEQEKPAAEQAPKAVASKTEEKIALDKDGLPRAWVVQVGSFGSEANADALVNKLRDAGYKAFSDRFQSGSRSLHRVQVGPVLEEARARELQAQINRRFNVKSIVNRFED